MLCLATIAVFARASYQLFEPTIPEFKFMGGIGLLALIANLICLFLLTRHRNDNINMSFEEKTLCIVNVLFLGFIVFPVRNSPNKKQTKKMPVSQIEKQEKWSVMRSRFLLRSQLKNCQVGIAHLSCRVSR